MSNRSFLVLSNADAPCPSVREPEFAPHEQTVAQGIYCVPLLWLALFRPTDLRTEQVESDDEPVLITAPVVAKAVALEQLEAARSLLMEMFPSQSLLPDYAATLRETIAQIDLQYITIEDYEIASMDDAASHHAHLRYALGSLASEVPWQVGRKSLLHLSSFDPSIELPALTQHSSLKLPTREQYLELSHVLGCGWERPVPWEP